MQKLLLWGGIGFAVLIVIIVTVTLMSRGNRQDQPSATTNNKITLTIWDPIDRKEIFDRIISKFQEKNPTVTINYVFKDPISLYETESTNALAAGKGPDIWLINNAFIQRHLDKLEPAPEGLFTQNKKEPIKNVDYVSKRFVPIVASENIHDGKLYSLPLFVDTMVLFSNPTLLRTRLNELTKAGISVPSNIFDPGPSTWNELVDLAKLYTKKEGNAITLPTIALGRSDNVANAQDILAMLMLQNGAEMASPDGLTATFNLPSTTSTKEQYYPGTKALDFYTSFSNPNKEHYTWNADFPNSYDAFRDGKLALMLDFSETSARLKQEAPNLNFKILPLPQIKGATTAVDFADYWTLTVPKSGQNKTASWAFVRYLNTLGLSTYLANSGRPNPLIPSSLPKAVSTRINSKNPFRYQTQTAKSWYHGKAPAELEILFLDMIDQAIDQNVKSQNAIDAASQSASLLFRSNNATPTP